MARFDDPIDPRDVRQHAPGAEASLAAANNYVAIRIGLAHHGFCCGLGARNLWVSGVPRRRAARGPRTAINVITVWFRTGELSLLEGVSSEIQAARARGIVSEMG
jgi:hypothetical protein